MRADLPTDTARLDALEQRVDALSAILARHFETLASHFDQVQAQVALLTERVVRLERDHPRIGSTWSEARTADELPAPRTVAAADYERGRG